MTTKEFFTARKAKIDSLQKLIDQEVADTDRELLLIIERQFSEITKLTFEKEKLEKKLAEFVPPKIA